MNLAKKNRIQMKASHPLYNRHYLLCYLLRTRKHVCFGSWKYVVFRFQCVFKELKIFWIHLAYLKVTPFILKFDIYFTFNMICQGGDFKIACYKTFIYRILENYAICFFIILILTITLMINAFNPLYFVLWTNLIFCSRLRDVLI